MKPVVAVASTEGSNSGRRKWKHRLHVNRRLITLKFLIFVMHGGTTVLYPFFIIHCLSMGLTLTESGIIFALIPVFGAIGNPLAGFLADKLGDYKKVVITFIMLSVVCHALLGFAVPLYSRKTIVTSHNITEVSLDIKCSAAENSEIYLHIQPVFSDTQQICFLKPRKAKGQKPANHCETNCSNQDLVTVCASLVNDQLRRQCYKLENITGINFSKFPTATFIENSGLWTIKNFTLIMEKKSDITNLSSYTDLTCQHENKNLPPCGITCQMPAEDVFLSCNKTVITGNRMKTFFLYTLFRVIGAMAVSAVMLLLDSATILMVKQHNGDFGMQRIFGIIGSLLFPPLGGYLIGVASVANKKQDYSPIFYIFCSMFTVGAVVIWLMDLQLKPQGKQIWSNVWKLLKNVKVSSFLIVIFLVGCFYGILENYLFWYMQTELKSPKWLLGMTNTVAGLAALPVVAASSWIIEICGHTKIFMLSLILYSVRFACYSIVQNPYLVLPVEVLEAFTFSLTFVTATIYSGKVAPAFMATLQGLVGAMHYSVGRGLGSFIAGTLFDHFSPRLVYQMVAGASAGCGLLYAILHYIWLRKAPDPKSDTQIFYSEADVRPHKDSATSRDDTEVDSQRDQVQSALLQSDHPDSDPFPIATYQEGIRPRVESQADSRPNMQRSS